MTAVILVDVAEEQLEEIVEWWTIHREANPTLAMEEFDRCGSRLESSPDAGDAFIGAACPACASWS